MAISKADWNEEKAKEYVAGGWRGCPICGSENEDGGVLQIDGTVAWQTRSCNDCGAEWDDVYELAHIDIKSFGDSEVALPGREN